jgi:hypothetical protein
MLFHSLLGGLFWGWLPCLKRNPSSHHTLKDSMAATSLSVCKTQVGNQMFLVEKLKLFCYICIANLIMVKMWFPRAFNNLESRLPFSFT